jgi:murein DD-endopeptidase MepM/ murein hydrolase activator NlpD
LGEGRGEGHESRPAPAGRLGPGRRVHYFAHLDAFSDVRPRDWVTPGAILGYVGTTGNARGTPPHLHYGLYGMGRAINPYPLLKAPRTP